MRLQLRSTGLHSSNKRTMKRLLTMIAVGICLTACSQKAEQKTFVYEGNPIVRSSAGRASALQAEGHRFEPCRSHSCKEQEIIRNGEIAQLARARGSYPRCRGFESPSRYEVKIQKFLKRVFGFFIFQKSVFFVDFTGYL